MTTTKSTEIDALLLRFLAAYHRAGHTYLYFKPGTDQAQALRRLRRCGLVWLGMDDDGYLAARLRTEPLA